MTGTSYAIYPPADAELPWLAVVLTDNKPVDMFGCESREAAETLLRAIRARHGDPNGADLESRL